MRTLVIVACLVTTSLYFLSTINAKEIDEWDTLTYEEQLDNNTYMPIEQYLNNEEEISKQEACLAEAIYFEARGEPFLGQVAVGVVILRRVHSPRFPNDICSVVHSGKHWKGNPVRNKCAFSYYCDGKTETIYNEHEYYKVMNAATLVLNGIVIDIMEDVLFYHATYVSPSWSKDMTFVFQIGKHRFYK